MYLFNIIHSLTPNKIFMVFNCKLCVHEYSDGKYGRNKSMEELSRITVGRTKTGIQVWCSRHGNNVVEIDLPADNKIMQMPMKCQFCEGPDCEHVS